MLNEWEGYIFSLFDFRKFLQTGLLRSLLKYDFNISSMEVEGECSSANMLQLNK